MNPLWNELAAKANLTLSDEQLARLDRYLDLLIEANATMNLTRITDRAAAEVGHVGDALTLLPFLPPIAGDADILRLRLADVGSGGGVPGIPLAIARPDFDVLLIESTKKKAAFLQSVVDRLKLTNVTVSSARAEEAGNSDLRQTFDVVTARAVGVLVFLVEWCLPLARKGGKVLAMKGPRVAEELPAALRPIRTLGGADAVVHPVALPGASGHVVVEIAKVGKTDKHFPRTPTFAKGKPMG